MYTDQDIREHISQNWHHWNHHGRWNDAPTAIRWYQERKNDYTLNLQTDIIPRIEAEGEKAKDDKAKAVTASANEQRAISRASQMLPAKPGLFDRTYGDGMPWSETGEGARLLANQIAWQGYSPEQIGLMCRHYNTSFRTTLILRLSDSGLQADEIVESLGLSSMWVRQIPQIIRRLSISPLPSPTGAFQQVMAGMEAHRSGLTAIPA